MNGVRAALRPRTKLTLAILFAAAGASCDGCSLFGPSDCGSKTSLTHTEPAPFAAPLPETTIVTGGVVHFSWSHEFDGLCVGAADSDTQAVFTMSFDAGPSFPKTAPEGLRFVGRVYHAAFIQPRTKTLDMPRTIVESSEVLAVENIGLKQGNDGISARVTAELDMSFVSSGNVQQDRATAQALMRQFHITMYYRKPE